MLGTLWARIYIKRLLVNLEFSIFIIYLIKILKYTIVSAYKFYINWISVCLSRNYAVLISSFFLTILFIEFYPFNLICKYM